MTKIESYNASSELKTLITGIREDLEESPNILPPKDKKQLVDYMDKVLAGGSEEEEHMQEFLDELTEAFNNTMDKAESVGMPPTIAVNLGVHFAKKVLKYYKETSEPKPPKSGDFFEYMKKPYVDVS